ncbi:hypothetical protein [Variovorax sp. J31P207]|uniref:hypothetical protein n=1 Tax=Variovorax sp. J31P207 TaxID=3053510 RepID=UPI002574ADB8|nr:hypothetical protein [Variovorax sp. J31P207]MDM0065141.1 hypothetical protein [Variovorax sp. J31P207]
MRSLAGFTLKAAAVATLLGGLLAGCASDPSRVPLGAPRDAVLQQLGPPTATYRFTGGERLQYSRGPAGFQVSNVDLDAAGRVQSVRQELDEGLFGGTIRPGEWRIPDVLFTYGPPYQQTRVTSFNGTVWSWRYLHINNRRFLYIYVDPTGLVDHYNVGDDLELERWRW